MNNNISVYNNYLKSFKSKSLKDKKKMKNMKNIYKHVEFIQREKKKY